MMPCRFIRTMDSLYSMIMKGWTWRNITYDKEGWIYSDWRLRPIQIKSRRSSTLTLNVQTQTAKVKKSLSAETNSLFVSLVYPVSSTTSAHSLDLPSTDLTPSLPTCMTLKRVKNQLLKWPNISCGFETIKNSLRKSVRIQQKKSPISWKVNPS